MPSRARLALMGAGVSLLSLLVVWFAAFHVARLQHVDQTVLKGFVDLSAHPHVPGLARRIAALCDPPPYVFFALLAIGVALGRRRGWLAVGVGMLLLAAPLTTELLKPLLAAPRPASEVFGLQTPIAPRSWPSGHATAAMSLALAFTLVVPARLRSVAAAAGAAFAAAVCFSFLALQWHYPSDVLGGFLIAFLWASLAVAGVQLVERGRARAGGSPVAGPVPLALALGPPVAALALVLFAGALVLLARPHQVVAYASAHKSFVVGGAVIGILALGLASGMSLLARR